jgi:conjugal transfer pilus assembly protein TraI
VFGHRLLDRAGHLLGLCAPDPTAQAPNTPDPPPASLTADTVLAPHAALVRRIRVAYGYPDDEFDQHLHAPIAALAAWLHLLPGHPGGGFERRGGAIEQALTTCLFSLQAAEGRTFEAGGDEGSAAPGHAQEWRLACALGGLFASLPDVLARIEVVSEDGSVWPGIALPLVDWLASLAITRYHYRWTSASGEFTRPAVYAAFRCIPTDAMSFIARGDSRIAAELISCIARTSDLSQVFHLVTRVAATVAACERDDAPAAAADRLVGTLRRLLDTSDWLPNSPGGHVWCGTDGLYLLWPDAAVKVLDALPGMRRAGRGASHSNLLQDLADGGIVETTPSPLVHIRTPGHDKPRLAVRLANHHQVLGDLRRGATPLDLRVKAPQTVQTADDKSAPRTSADGDTASPATGANGGQVEAKGPAQCVLDFAGEHTEGDAAAEATASALSLDTSRITNPRTREAIDQVVARLDHSFDSMLAKPVNAGVFVALTEFVGRHGDGASVVRALYEAQLLACDGSTADRRVTREVLEGTEQAGVVLRATAFTGYAAWAGRWRAEQASRCSPLGEAAR